MSRFLWESLQVLLVFPVPKSSLINEILYKKLSNELNKVATNQENMIKYWE